MLIRNIVRAFASALLLVSALHVNVASADEGNGRNRLVIGGVGNVYFINDTQLVGSAAGTFAALSSTIHSFVPQGDGTYKATLTHNFLAANNGFIITDDVMILVPVKGRPDVYSFQVDYTVVKSGHGLDGYEGQKFKSQGLVDLKNSVAEVRYDGVIYSNR